MRLVLSSFVVAVLGLWFIDARICCYLPFGEREGILLLDAVTGFVIGVALIRALAGKDSLP